jgi:hypothetical protein
MESDEPNDNELAGMTLNERLVVCGLYAEWNLHAKTRDREAMISVLSRAGLSVDEARYTAESVLADPRRFGF